MLRTLEGSDASVQGTNDDAQISKLSCAKAGYFRDEFIHFFVRRASRRSPLINRGYYSRHAALRQLLTSFLQHARAAADGAAAPDSAAAGDSSAAVGGAGAASDGNGAAAAAAAGSSTRPDPQVPGSSGCSSSGGGGGGGVRRPEPQVLVLGAGFDTTWFQLTRDAGGAAPYRCLEVDFKEVTQRKAAIIAREPQLHSLLRQPPQCDSTAASGASQPREQQEQPLRQAQGQERRAAAVAADAPAAPATASGPGRPAGAAASGSGPASLALPRPGGPGSGPASAGSGCGTSGAAGAAVPDLEGVDLDPVHGQVVSSHYSLVPVDLREVGQLDRAVELAGWDRSAPTYILSECVLVYLEPQHSSAVVRWAAGAFSNAVMAIYEQIRPDDAFGRQMVSNLELRGCPLRGLHATPSLQAHRDRLTTGGWSWADAADMDTLYRAFVEPADRARAERLELFDELEEWHMIQEHYCIALGRNDAAGWLFGFGFNMRQPAGPHAPGFGAPHGLFGPAGRAGGMQPPPPMPPPASAAAGGRRPLVVD